MNYKDLEVYKRAYKLAIEIHKYSLTLPKVSINISKKNMIFAANSFGIS